jgi:hypothetical protein
MLVCTIWFFFYLLVYMCVCYAKQGTAKQRIMFMVCSNCVNFIIGKLLITVRSLRFHEPLQSFFSIRMCGGYDACLTCGFFMKCPVLILRYFHLQESSLDTVYRQYRPSITRVGDIHSFQYVNKLPTSTVQFVINNCTSVHIKGT